MPDFENDFAVEEAVSEAAADALEEERQAEPAAVAEVVEIPVEIDDEDDDDFFDDDETSSMPEVDPATVVTIRTSQGRDMFVDAPRSMPLVDAIAKSGLRFTGDFTCWLNGQEVGLGTVVSGGQTVTIVGAVKGG